MVTLKDIANEVGVTMTTVSNALNGRGSVSKAKQNRIRATAKKMGYRPNRKAQAMRTGVTNSIGLALPDFTNPYFPELAQAIEVAARQAGFTTILVDTQDDVETERSCISILEQDGVDGLIWFPARSTVPKEIRSLTCPIVVVDRPAKGFDVVQSDYVQGGELLADFIVQKGHKKIGMLCGPQNYESASQRRRGFIDCIAGRADIVWEIEVPFSRELNQQAHEKLKNPNVSLIVAADDLIAIGAIKALNRHGISVPDDVSIVGFDNISWSSVITPALTTINQPTDRIGTEAFNLLLSKIRNSDQPPKKIILPVNLVERDSVKVLNL